MSGHPLQRKRVQQTRTNAELEGQRSEGCACCRSFATRLQPQSLKPRLPFPVPLSQPEILNYGEELVSSGGYRDPEEALDASAPTTAKENRIIASLSITTALQAYVE